MYITFKRAYQIDVTYTQFENYNKTKHQRTKQNTLGRTEWFRFCDAVSVLSILEENGVVIIFPERKNETSKEPPLY